MGGSLKLLHFLLRPFPEMIYEQTVKILEDQAVNLRMIFAFFVNA